MSERRNLGGAEAAITTHDIWPPGSAASSAKLLEAADELIEGLSKDPDCDTSRLVADISGLIEVSATETNHNLIPTKDKGIRPILANAATVLREHASWKGVLGLNQFSLHAMTRRMTPWGGEASKNWTDTDDIRTAEWLQHHGVLVSPQVASNAVEIIAEENPFHPVKDYLTKVKRDGEDRLSSWPVLYLGAPDTTYVRAVGIRWLISAVARIFRPGCQADHTLLLEGPQGILKSTALRTLAGPEWFSDHLSDLDSKDSRIELHGVWILELAELANIKHSLTEKVKSFLTARSDHFRPPYGRRAIDVPRTNVFAASVNDSTPFVDETGNRRFWPVRCGNIQIKKLEQDRDLLWAEAYARYMRDEVWWLETPELNSLASQEQRKRYQSGPWDGLIEKYLDDCAADKVTIDDIRAQVINAPLSQWRQADMNCVARCLRLNGWERVRVRIGEKLRWCYKRPDLPTVPSEDQ